jgi:hypothetical protein
MPILQQQIGDLGAHLGGLIVEVGDRTSDLNVQSRVSKLNQLLYETL